MLRISLPLFVPVEPITILESDSESSSFTLPDSESEHNEEETDFFPEIDVPFLLSDWELLEFGEEELRLNEE